MSLNMPIRHKCTADCEYCGHVDMYSFNIEDIEEVSSTEEVQGTETQYDYTVYVKCSGCGAEIEITGEVWEYPYAVLNLVTPEK